MKIGILGSGTVAQTLGTKLASVGHDVMLGSRQPAKLAEWVAKAGPPSGAGTLPQVAAHGEVIINATNGMASVSALQMAGAANLDGKILIDVAVPLDFSQGFPPTLSPCNTDSLAEQIQRAFPNVRVVKTLNTVTAPLMVNPRALAGGDHTIFVCGNDASAKAQVRTWLHDWFGWEQVLDLGDITSARGVEMWLALWVRLMSAAGTVMFNIKVVK